MEALVIYLFVSLAAQMLAIYYLSVKVLDIVLELKRMNVTHDVYVGQFLDNSKHSLEAAQQSALNVEKIEVAIDQLTKVAIIAAKGRIDEVTIDP